MMYAKRKELSEKEIKILEQNPFVSGVENNTVHFIPEFYKMAYSKKLDGFTSREILKSIGIDPQILGESRVDSLNSNLNTWRREYYYRHPDDPNEAKRQQEIEILKNQKKELEQQLKKLKSESDQLFNAYGYYKAENIALKKK